MTASSSPYGYTGTLTANPPKTGGPKFPENRENNREFRQSEAIPVLSLDLLITLITEPIIICAIWALSTSGCFGAQDEPMK
jgi:hypothetical protein